MFWLCLVMFASVGTSFVCTDRYIQKLYNIHWLKRDCSVNELLVKEFFSRKIKGNISQSFDASSIILKIEVVNGNLKVVIRSWVWSWLHSSMVISTVTYFKHTGMPSTNNNFHIDFNDLILENDDWCIKTLINIALNLSCQMLNKQYFIAWKNPKHTWRLEKEKKLKLLPSMRVISRSPKIVSFK